MTNGNGVVVNGRLITLNSVNLAPTSGGFPQINATITATTYTEPAPQVSSSRRRIFRRGRTGRRSGGIHHLPVHTPAPTAAISPPIQ